MMNYSTPAVEGGMRIKLPVFVLVCLIGFGGCYHYRVVAPKPDPATEYHKETVHSFLWGLMQTKDIPASDCVKSNGIDEIVVTTNYGYALITVVSLGIWCPMEVEWRCSKPCQQIDEL